MIEHRRFETRFDLENPNAGHYGGYQRGFLSDDLSKDVRTLMARMPQGAIRTPPLPNGLC